MKLAEVRPAACVSFHAIAVCPLPNPPPPRKGGKSVRELALRSLLFVSDLGELSVLCEIICSVGPRSTVRGKKRSTRYALLWPQTADPGPFDHKVAPLTPASQGREHGWKSARPGAPFFFFSSQVASPSRERPQALAAGEGL
jgi:hypothetical protein